MEKQLEDIVASITEKIKSAKNLQELNQVYVEIFGKSSKLSKLTKNLSIVSLKERRKIGSALNEAKKKIEELYLVQKNQLQKQRPKEEIDTTAPGKKTELGHTHLITQATAEIISIFSRLGFSLQSYPEIDWDWYAFEALNMPKNHPARDEWETFFVKTPSKPKLGNQVLTPHTSNGQVREMERVKKPPIRMINIARCYRRQIDVSHTPMFHQFEGLLIDKNIGIPDLKGTFDYFTSNFFGPDITTRLRPHHFRFTEPSFEVDITCSVCFGKGCRFCKDGWVELGGAGIVHPKVLEAGNIDPQKFSGFAFGWGIERTIAIKTGIGDIRLLYQNDIRFLEQF